MGKLGTAEFHAAAPASLVVDIIDTWAEFRALKPDWQALEARDPQATVFLSWDWLAQAFRDNPGRWRVVIVHGGDRLVCVLPLKYRVHWSNSARAFQSQIEAGGRLLWSEYTGFLCDPALEAQALQLVAARLRALPWSRLSLRYEDTPDRAARFLRAFPQADYSAKLAQYRINKGETDNLICPRVPLPDSFDDYLAALPSRGRRQKLRRAMRQLDSDADLRITRTTPATFDQDIAGLLRLWTAKWAPSKGPDVAARVAGNYRQVLQAALRLGNLHMPVLWRGDRMLGALGHVLDPHRHRLCFVVGGRDDAAADQSIGLMLHGAAIRWAIGAGQRNYDFCHGDEAYKFTYGARPERVNYLSVRRRSGTAPAARLDPIGRPEAMRRLLDFIETGDRDRAARACRQLLET
ncbi:GNAT family N-acetyltransferase [Seohaeicola saemankumensis]|nr:GNAT family N-acetyltransferase [Seohaeicola saemankumensis]MCA0869481.1 GNAT family N-acetyltransferase [Seohaeicola saemankumensis]